MDIRLEWLRAFRAIMQAGTVTSAANIVLRTQPQISRMIAGLEASSASSSSRARAAG